MENASKVHACVERELNHENLYASRAEAIGNLVIRKKQIYRNFSLEKEIVVWCVEFRSLKF